MLTDDELKAVRERAAGYPSNTPVTDAVEDRRAMLRHIDALTAKLRVAVEALQAVKAESRTSDALWFEGVYDKIATAAMEAIGPLPLPQMPTPLPGEGE